MDKPGDRILVIGSPGSGKSTFSKRLADITGIPLIHLDREFWNPGWVETPNQEWIEKQRRLIAKDRWIIDGNYGGTLDLRIERADTIICFQLNRVICVGRYFRRVVTNLNKSRPDMSEGCPEHLDIGFMKYIWNFPKASGSRNVEKLYGKKDKNLICFKKRRDADKYIEEIIKHRDQKQAPISRV